MLFLNITDNIMINKIIFLFLNYKNLNINF